MKMTIQDVCEGCTTIQQTVDKLLHNLYPQDVTIALFEIRRLADEQDSIIRQLALVPRKVIQLGVIPDTLDSMTDA